jgi:hypothetical protein
VNVILKWGCAAVLLLGPMAWAQESDLSWAIATAPARFVIEPDQADKPATLSSVTLYLPDPNWGGYPLRVFTDAGAPVGSSTIWSSPGGPTTVIFDSSSNSRLYKVYMGATNWPPLPIPNTANAGVLLESRPGDGKSVDHLPDMLAAWKQSRPTLGRELLNGIFEGGNRFGPEMPIFTYFQGWFDVAAQEHLELAAISNDASFVLVDGKEVVEWPGLHDVWPGIKAEHNGAVDLAPGPHLLEYYNAYVPDKERNRPLWANLAVKGGTIEKWTMANVDGAFFRPAGHMHVTDYQLESSADASSSNTHTPPFAFSWDVTGQSLIAPTIADIGLIAVQFNCLPKTAGTITWTFDDGTTAQGPSISHLFARPGERLVKISVKDVDGTTDLGSVVRTIDVHPNWVLLNNYQPQLNPDHLTEMMTRDPKLLSAADLVGCAAVFSIFKSTDGLLKILPALVSKMKEVQDIDLPYLKDAGTYLTDNDTTHTAVTGPFLQALSDRSAAARTGAGAPPASNTARLALVKIKLRTTDNTADVKALLDGVKVDTLVGEEKKTYDILRADLALAMGDVAGARLQYQTATGAPGGPDVRSSIRRTARIAQARSYLDQKDYESADDALWDVKLAEPIATLSPDWALTQLRAYQEEGLTNEAFIWAVRLLPVITDDGRSELLFRLTDLAYAQKLDDVGKKSLTELLKNFPYSQAAARAKEKWPDKI